jgi:hypothetical protein
VLSKLRDRYEADWPAISRNAPLTPSRSFGKIPSVFTRLDYDHLIGAAIFVVLLCVVGVGALGVPAISETVIDSAESVLVSPRLTPRPELVWVWPATATPEPLPPTVPNSGCNEPFRLAGSLDAEGRNQPLAVRMAMAGIVVAEAQSRSMNICELTERTNFLTSWRYAQLNPWSWVAQQFKKPSESSTQVARLALTGQLYGLRGGAMHFDGAFWEDNDWRCRSDVIWKGGTTCFYP